MEKDKYLPGYWILLHTLTYSAYNAYKTKQPLEKDRHTFIIRMIKEILSNTGCDECNKHAGEYVRKNRPEDAYASGGYEGLFYWTVDFHNTVSARIKKPIYTRQDALDFYSKNCNTCTVKVVPEVQTGQAPCPQPASSAPLTQDMFTNFFSASRPSAYGGQSKKEVKAVVKEVAEAPKTPRPSVEERLKTDRVNPALAFLQDTIGVKKDPAAVQTPKKSMFTD